MQPWLLYISCKLRILYGQIEIDPQAEERFRSWSPTDLPEAVEEIAETLGIGFIDPTPCLVAASRAGALPYNAVFDSHLNRRGSDCVAAALAAAPGPHLPPVASRAAPAVAPSSFRPGLLGGRVDLRCPPVVLRRIAAGLGFDPPSRCSAPPSRRVSPPDLVDLAADLDHIGCAKPARADCDDAGEAAGSQGVGVVDHGSRPIESPHLAGAA